MDPQTQAANNLLAIARSDIRTHATTYHLPGPFPPAHLAHHALSYTSKVRRRLHPSLYHRFLTILDSHGRSIGTNCVKNVDHTREEVSVVFELANEYELWEEFLDAFCPCWKRKREVAEQREMAMGGMGGMGDGAGRRVW
ncbi:MAG: hypothetical protein Q9219_004314 [cf. Caloplaca sp. 3 TL-2023]